MRKFASRRWSGAVICAISSLSTAFPRRGLPFACLSLSLARRLRIAVSAVPNVRASSGSGNFLVLRTRSFFCWSPGSTLTSFTFTPNLEGAFCEKAKAGNCAENFQAIVQGLRYCFTTASTNEYQGNCSAPRWLKDGVRSTEQRTECRSGCCSSPRERRDSGH